MMDLFDKRNLQRAVALLASAVVHATKGEESGMSVRADAVVRDAETFLQFLNSRPRR